MLKKFDFKLHHRFNKNQHIDIVDELNRMFTKLQNVTIYSKKKRLTMSMLNVNLRNSSIYLSNEQSDHSFEIDSERKSKIERNTKSLLILFFEKLNKYYRFSMYSQLMKYFEKKSNDLKKQKLIVKKIKILENKINVYILFSHVITTHLLYREANEKNSICIIEKKISRFLKIIHENHDHFSSILTFDFLIKRIY